MVYNRLRKNKERRGRKTWRTGKVACGKPWFQRGRRGIRRPGDRQLKREHATLREQGHERKGCAHEKWSGRGTHCHRPQRRYSAAVRKGTAEQGCHLYRWIMFVNISYYLLNQFLWNQIYRNFARHSFWGLLLQLSDVLTTMRTSAR